jgi:hypothetical protein
MLATFGAAPVDNFPRFTSVPRAGRGFNVLTVLIGLFAGPSAQNRGRANGHIGEVVSYKMRAEISILKERLPAEAQHAPLGGHRHGHRHPAGLGGSTANIISTPRPKISRNTLKNSAPASWTALSLGTSTTPHRRRPDPLLTRAYRRLVTASCWAV